MVSIGPIIRGKFNHYTELFAHISNILIEEKAVKPGFKEILLQREEKFPTGLDTGTMSIAIPHTGRDMVIKETLALAICSTPLCFRKMGNPAEEIYAHIVFFPLVKAKQASFLATLLNNIRNSDILNKIYNAKDDQQVWQLLKTSLHI